ncbi:hypothetical protein [Methylobacterium frigidaeris]|uniref:Uncharacterized protein n=1 Tax=Methylobacterium frigidaeris TaxID=2038277 RepID=A0AA37M900_9HYPH|nr:hypothetical protein [Methylobacterium frigidaeris]GJD67029.1 hypothetical protein MPEAHAMD_7228 [Methylobacterium frigidaeris]
MLKFQLRILHRRTTNGGMDTHSEWLTVRTTTEAVAQAEERISQVLAGQAGIGMLSDERDTLIWSVRHDLPKPTDLG